MKRLKNINPNSVISVTEIAPEEQKDDFIYICSLITNESVLMPYNPLERIKQFIKYGYSVVKDKDDNLKTEKVAVYINYYGLEVTKFVKNSSHGDIKIVLDTIYQATNYIHQHSLDEFCA